MAGLVQWRRWGGVIFVLVAMSLVAACTRTRTRTVWASAQASLPPETLPPMPMPPPPPPPESTPVPVDAAQPPLPNACRGVPRFPWRPDRPSGTYTLSNALFARRDASLATVADDLRGALRAAGYGDPTFYCMNGGGFALVTQLERIDEERRPFPAPARWNSAPAGLLEGQDVTVANVVRALFSARPGRYRQIVFVVGPLPIVPSHRTMTAAQSQRLASGGASQLPWGFDAYRFAPPQAVTALVYEFVRPRLDSEPVLVTSTVPVGGQLLAAGVLRGRPVRLARP